jgi:hypothetical protein
MSRRWILLAGSVLALAAAGCGGGDGGGDRLSREEFETRLQEIGNTIGDSLDELSGLSDPESLDQVADQVEEGANALRDGAEEIAGLEPPEDAEEATDQIVEGTRELADEFERIADLAREGEIAELAEVGTAIASSEGVQKIQSAIQELEGMGYGVGEDE